MVVKVYMCDLNLGRVLHRFPIHTKAMVLCGDFAAAP
jgi:hypothetical protein